MSLQKIFAANWKLNKSPHETRKFIAEFRPLLENAKAKGFKGDVVLFPSATSLEAAATGLAGTGIHCGAQNIWKDSQGAFTGETSASVVKELGAQWVLIGHSERRQIFSESDDLLSAKLKLVQSLGLQALFCVGESLAEREAGLTNEVLQGQIEKGLALRDPNAFMGIAYEPVWAIGTGKVATTEQVAEAHRFLRRLVGAETPILYGGSVKPDNAKSLLKVDHLDGFLVGGASLDPVSFSGICF